MTSKAQEAGVVDDDTNSLASSFASVGRASPTSSISSSALDRDEPRDDDDDEPPPYSPPQPQQHQPPPTLQPSTQSEVVAQPVAPAPPIQPEQAPQATQLEPPSWTSQDPRSVSTESLVAQPAPQDRRRRLLLIFIHGFMGNETSFQSFPAHLHNLLSILLAESHTVHTKIYPRYRTKKALQLATNEFSDWLVPHQDFQTDVVLLGHSMGGLLAADVALTRERVTQLLRHNLLGTVSFDTPFCGMHPGVVWSGLSSVFRPAPSPPKTPQPGSLPPSETLAQTPSSDPHFNPSFTNDIHLPVRTAWENTMHFMNKHSKHLHHATKQLVSSHVEFGSALADANALKVRYVKIKALDHEQPQERVKALDGLAVPKRTRFVNYYTASTGRPKKPKQHSIDEESRSIDASTSRTTPEPAAVENTTLPSASAPELGSGDIPSRPATQPGTHDRLRSPIKRKPVNSGISSLSSRTEDRSSPAASMRGHSPMRSRTIPDIEPSPRLRAPASARDLRSTPRAHSPAPSYTTLPSYTTEPQPLTPVPSYPYSRRDPSVTTPSLVSSHRTASTTSTNVTRVSSDSIAPQALPGPPPLPSDYPQDPQAYADAHKSYLQASKECQTALKAYKDQHKQRKSEAKALRKEWKAALISTREEERILDQQLREDEQRRIAEAPNEEMKRFEEEVVRERRRREKEMRLDQYKAMVEETKQRKKSISHADKADRKKMHKLQKEARKAHKNAAKEERKAWKATKTGQKPPCPLNRADNPNNVLGPPESTSFDGESMSDLTEFRTISPSSTAHDIPPSTSVGCPQPPDTVKHKDRKFCRLPKDADGNRDSSWVRVFMQDVDEVGAHCGLFLPQGEAGSEAIADQVWSERYAWLVADVAERIETWVQDEMTERLVSGVEAL